MVETISVLFVPLEVRRTKSLTFEVLPPTKLDYPDLHNYVPKKVRLYVPLSLSK